MKFLETHFIDYTNAINKLNMHPKLTEIYDNFPENLSDMPNIIFYGPSGVGKYSQVLYSIQKYSPSLLKYEKKINIIYEKKNFVYKISDIHFEIDMSLLGCVSKILWHEIYQQIINIISLRQDKTGIIVCKQFQNTHNELIDIFYSYMQENTSTSIKPIFILITEDISFISEHIINSSKIIHINRPSKNIYAKCLKTNGSTNSNKLTINNITNITNIKNMHIGEESLNNHHMFICNKIINVLVNFSNLNFSKLRDYIYEMLVYNLDISTCIWYIYSTVISKEYIKRNNLTNTLLQTYNFFKLYNNNYRPIYHLENYLLYLLRTIHEI